MEEKETSAFYVSALDVEEWATRCINLERDLNETNKELSKKYIEFDKLFEEAEQIRIERDEAMEELGNQIKWHYRTHKELVEAQCKILDMQMGRDDAMDVLSNLSHYLGCGLGDEKTTAQEYGARIREGINALTDPIVEEKERLRKIWVKQQQ